MKPHHILLLLVAALLSACGSPPPPAADFVALRKQLLQSMASPMVPLLLLCCLVLASCSLKPTAILPDGTKISVGGSIMTKSGTEASVAEANTKGGTHVKLTYTSSGLDETSLGGQYFTFRGLKAGIDGTTKVTQSNNATKVATDPGTKITTTGADGSVTEAIDHNPNGAAFFNAVKH